MDFGKDKLLYETNFVFTLWKYPSLYGKYMKKIEKLNIFLTNSDAKFFYALGKHMYKDGFKEFDGPSVFSYVSKREALKNVFESKGGYETFMALEPELSKDNADGYFNEIIKINCFVELQDKGFDIGKDYDKLSLMQPEQIKMYYTYQLNNIIMHNVSEGAIEQVIITDDDIENFNDGTAMGISIANTAPLLNYEILGINRGLTFVGGTVNAGKTSATLALIVMGWVKDKRKVCLISNEQTILEFKQIFLSMASYEVDNDSGLARRRIKLGKFDNNESNKIKKAQAYFNENYSPYISFKQIFDYSLGDVQMTIDILSAQGYEGFVYDVFKSDDRSSGKVVDEMVEMSKSLFQTAKNNDVAVVATIQLGLSFSDVRFVNMLTISTSKHITEPATEVILMRDMWEDECTDEKFDIKIYNYTYNARGQKIIGPDGKPIKKYISIYGDEYKDIKLAFISKTRNTRRDTVIAYRFNGDYNVWEELGYCNPKHENRNSKRG